MNIFEVGSQRVFSAFSARVSVPSQITSLAIVTSLTEVRSLTLAEIGPADASQHR